MAVEKCRQAWNDFAGAVNDRKRDPYRAAQGVQASRGILSVVQFSKDVARPLEELLSRCGQGKPPRRAQQKLHAKPRLQLSNDSRDRGLRQIHVAGSAGEAAR